MKRAFLAFFAIGLLTIMSGCTTDPACCPRRCGSAFGEAACRCGRPDCPQCGCRHGCQGPAESNPATGAVTYPYYTLHGPRDFLQCPQWSIGP